jgi:hypothetical protein
VPALRDLSGARHPVVLYGSLRLPFILPQDTALHAVVRKAHPGLAYPSFLMFLAHFGAVLYHAPVVRDGLLLRMAPWNGRPPEAAPPDADRPGGLEICDAPLDAAPAEGGAVRPPSWNNQARASSGIGRAVPWEARRPVPWSEV